MWYNFIKNHKDKKEANHKKEIERIKYIKSDIAKMTKFCKDESVEIYRRSRENCNTKNSICPLCKSKNINDRIKRQQGTLDGSSNNSNYNGLFFNSSYNSSAIHGKLDTNEVNKCNDCGYEWKKEEIYYTNEHEIIRNKLETVLYLLNDLTNYKTCTFDDTDINEQYSSFEEKQKILYDYVYNSYRFKKVKEEWHGCHIESFKFLVIDKLNEYWEKRINIIIDELFLIEEIGMIE